MGLLFKAILEQLAIRGQRERDRREEWERSLKPTVCLGNNLFQEMGGNPIAGRYLGQRSLIPGQFVPNIGRNPNKPVIPGLPVVPTEAIEEEIFIPKIQIPYLVDLEPLVISSSNQGYRIVYYRGDQKIILGDFRVYSVPTSISPYISWVYEEEAKPRWRDWVIWVRIGDYGVIQLDNEEANQPTPGGVSWFFERRETTIGIKGSGNTVIESRIYVRRINQDNNINVYASAIGEGLLSYTLFDSANYDITVITPEDFLDTYDADNPINNFREDRLQWHPVDLDNDPIAPFPYPSTVNYINADLLEVVSESTGRWVEFGHPPEAEHIIGGTTR